MADDLKPGFAVNPVVDPGDPAPNVDLQEFAKLHGSEQLSKDLDHLNRSMGIDSVEKAAQKLSGKAGT